MGETVKIPKVMADEIREMPWFRLYNDLEDFVLEAVRKREESWTRLWYEKQERDEATKHEECG